MPCAHDYQPVTNMRAVYRCATCGGFAYKSKVRTGVVGDNGFTPYTCRHPGCSQPVVVMFPTIRARRTLRPSCAEHRPDKP